MFEGHLFWILVVLAAVFLQFVPKGNAMLRAAILTGLGVAGLVFALQISPAGIVVLAVGLASLWLGCRRLLAGGGKDKFAYCLALVAPVLVAWVFGKFAVAMNVPRLAPLLFVGLSFFLVKAWSLLRDVVDRKVREISFWEFAGYLLHLPTYALGPMHSFSEFHGTLREPYTLTGERVVDIAFRFSLGMLKVYILSGLLVDKSLLAFAHADHLPLLHVVAGAFVYSFVLYFDFSGYCDMAIAVSRLLGVDVPENFNWPYLATSMRDFWRRWHITFSRMLTAHVFIPLTRKLQKNFPRSPLLVSSLGYFGTFLFCGYWHGPTANFLLWGIWHAVGFIVQDLWMRSRQLGPRKPPGKKAILPRALDTAITFGYVSIGWIFFVLPLELLPRITWH